MKNPQSFILRTTATLLFFVVNLFALYLLLRGHNLPGGGFIAGLASSISLILLGLARGFDEVELFLRGDPFRFAAYGLLIAITSALLPMIPGFPGTKFFEHTMFHLDDLPFFGNIHVGTTLLFDIGVLLVVVGISSKVVIVLARSTSGRLALNEKERAYYSSTLESPIEEGHSQENPEITDDGS